MSASSARRCVWAPSIAVLSTVGLLLIVAAPDGQAGAQAEPPAAQLAALCAGCHRLDNRPNGIPPVISLSAEEIVAMMRGFKARPLSSPVMHVVSHALSDAEIFAVAGYLSGLAGKSAR